MPVGGLGQGPGGQWAGGQRGTPIPNSPILWAERGPRPPSATISSVGVDRGSFGFVEATWLGDESLLDPGLWG